MNLWSSAHCLPGVILRCSLACHGRWDSSWDTLEALQHFLDFVFLSHLPGTAVPAHRAILVARCEVMAAMFNGNYMEAKSVLIPVYGVSKETFLSFLEYLYTDSCCPGTQYVCYKVISRDSSFSLFLVVCCLWNLFGLRSTSQFHGICWAALRWCRESVAFQLIQMKEQGSVARTNSRLLVNLDTRESRCLRYLMAALILEFGSPTCSRRKGIDGSFRDPHIWLKWFSGLLLVWTPVVLQIWGWGLLKTATDFQNQIPLKLVSLKTFLKCLGLWQTIVSISKFTHQRLSLTSTHHNVSS